MKITIYELLGMVKDGKAPKKIKWGYHNFEWCVVEYVALDEYGKPSLCEVVGNIECVLNDEIEILDNLEEEKKIPEKIKDKYCSQISKVELAQKYNEIIDYLKSKGDE
ncbi:MAG: hypothetical protein IKN65_00975 [Clostridia bacterium]|nr:hypothetical protein [Clostridia bacterium]